MKDNIKIMPVTLNSEIWGKLVEYADNCSWSAGKHLAKHMRANKFVEWERVFVALSSNNIAGYCTFVKTDCIPDVPYSPYISCVFVGEEYRGNRLSEKMIDFSLVYAKENGFEQVYLVSDQVNLYEKYGFIKIDEAPAPWDANAIETIFMHTT